MYRLYFYDLVGDAITATAPNLNTILNLEILWKQVDCDNYSIGDVYKYYDDNVLNICIVSYLTKYKYNMENLDYEYLLNNIFESLDPDELKIYLTNDYSILHKYDVSCRYKSIISIMKSIPLDFKVELF